MSSYIASNAGPSLPDRVYPVAGKDVIPNTSGRKFVPIKDNVTNNF